MSLDPEESDSQWKGEVAGKVHSSLLDDPPTADSSHSLTPVLSLAASLSLLQSRN